MYGYRLQVNLYGKPMLKISANVETEGIFNVKGRRQKGLQMGQFIVPSPQIIATPLLMYLYTNHQDTVGITSSRRKALPISALLPSSLRTGRSSNRAADDVLAFLGPSILK